MESKVNSAPDRALKAFWLYCTSSVNDLFFFIQTFQKSWDCPGAGDSQIKVTAMLLVSLRVFGTESHYICPFRYRLYGYT